MLCLYFCAEGRCLEADSKLLELRGLTDLEETQMASACGMSSDGLAALPGRAKEYQTAVADIRNDEGWDVARDNALRALHRHQKGEADNEHLAVTCDGIVEKEN